MSAGLCGSVAWHGMASFGSWLCMPCACLGACHAMPCRHVVPPCALLGLDLWARWLLPTRHHGMDRAQLKGYG